jgi:hypothetical protein
MEAFHFPAKYITKFVIIFPVPSVTKHNSFSIFKINPVNKPYGDENYLRGHQLCSYFIIYQHFMEPKVSLMHSQELSTCPCSEPDQSSPQHPILSLSLRPILILSTHLCLWLPSSLIPFVTPTNNLYAFLFSPFTLHATPTSSSSTW